MSSRSDFPLGSVADRRVGPGTRWGCERDRELLVGERYEALVGVVGFLSSCKVSSTLRECDVSSFRRFADDCDIVLAPAVVVDKLPVGSASLTVGKRARG